MPEIDTCKQCDSALDDKGFCTNAPCDFADWPQSLTEDQIRRHPTSELIRTTGARPKFLSDHVLYRPSKGTVPAGWWWHKRDYRSAEAEALKGTEGVDFDGPWSTALGAQEDYDETQRAADASV